MYKQPSLAKHFRLLVVAAMAVALLVFAPAAQAAPDSTLIKAASPHQVTVGQSFTFTLEEINNTQNTINVTVTDNLPPNLAVNGSGSFFGNSTALSTCAFPPPSGGGTVSCDFGLIPGSVEGFQFSVKAIAAGFATNTATDDQGNISSVVVCGQNPDGTGCSTPPPPAHHKKHHRHHHH